MITITHHDSEGSASVCEDDLYAGIKLDCYTRGWDKPNYPMPAIRTEVCHFPSGLSLAIIEWKGKGFSVLHYWEDLSHYVQHDC